MRNPNIRRSLEAIWAVLPENPNRALGVFDHLADIDYENNRDATTTVTTNQLVHVLSILDHGDWAEQLLDEYAASERHALPDVDSDPAFGAPVE